MTQHTSVPATPLNDTIGGTAQSPCLIGARCSRCDRVFGGPRQICPACCSETLTPVRLAETGAVYSHTVVHRSYAGVATPFVDVVVDLDDGAHLRGTLVDADPDALGHGMRVDVAWRTVNLPAPDGPPYLTYVFRPASREGS